MKRKYRVGAITGTFFSCIAYAVASFRGFNSSSFVLFLYLYVLLGVISKFELEDAAGYIESLENFTWVKQEEKKLKKVFTGEEYEIEGTVKKV